MLLMFRIYYIQENKYLFIIAENKSIPKNCNLFYRYRFSTYHCGCSLDLIIYHSIKETQHGYWITDSDVFTFTDSKYIDKHWISKTSRKRFAYPTKKEAITNFVKRTEKRIKILQQTINDCNVALAQAKLTNIDE